jgi:2-amino-4-hydroxy-6-hydroxymethyldihydropteridine diphosphokinase
MTISSQLSAQKALPLIPVMNKALISIGSNEDSKMNLETSRRMLSEHFVEISFTGEMETEPYGKQYQGLFLNQLAVAFTSLTLEDVNNITKMIEHRLGRLPQHKTEGVVKIDIDVFGWNNEIIRPEDYRRPYVQELLPQLTGLLKNKK